MTIPQCGDPGAWTVHEVRIADSRNLSVYTTAQLTGMGIATTLNVQSLDAKPPRIATSPTTLPHANPLVITFTEPTLWAGSSETADPFYIFDNTTHATVTGTWTCKNASDVTVGCYDDDAGVVTASFQPSVPWTAGDAYGFETYTDHQPRGIYDVSGNGPLSFQGGFTAS